MRTFDHVNNTENDTAQIRRGIDHIVPDLVQNFRAMDPSEIQELFGRDALAKVKNLLALKDLNLNVDRSLQPILKRIVENTFDWGLNTDEKEATLQYRQWLQGHKNSCLYVFGELGTGKTSFCAKLYAEMNHRDSRDTLAAFFQFMPNQQKSQSVSHMLSSVIWQIAEQDAKCCSALAKSSTTFRKVYVLLDDIHFMKSQDLKHMLKFFQDLHPYQNRIQILMTGDNRGSIPKLNDTPWCWEVDMVEATKVHGDLERIVDYHLKNSQLDKKSQSIVRTELKNVPDSKPEIASPKFRYANMYHFLETLSVIELAIMTLKDTASSNRSQDEYIKEKIRELFNETGMLTEIMKKVLEGKNPVDRKFAQLIFKYCTFAKEPLTVYQLEYLISAESQLPKSSDLSRQIYEASPELLIIHDYQSNATVDHHGGMQGGMTAETQSERFSLKNNRFEVVTFRQSVFKDRLQRSENSKQSSTESLIPDPIQAKVDIFVKLVDILCGKDNMVEDLQPLRVYAAKWLMGHLKDINVREVSSQQARRVVEAMMQVLTNTNNVCRVFESVQNSLDNYTVALDLYATDRDDADEHRDLFLKWAAWMQFHSEERPSDGALKWIKEALEERTPILENIARGHMISWMEARTATEAESPYLLLSATLWSLGQFSDEGTWLFWTKTSVSRAHKIIQFGDQHSILNSRNFVTQARCRIAAALGLTNSSWRSEDWEGAQKLYQENIDKWAKADSPEMFYSHLGLAETYIKLKPESGGSSDFIDTWANVLEHSSAAMEIWERGKEFRSDVLRKERCIEGFYLKAKASSMCARTKEAIETCKVALRESRESTPRFMDILSMLIELYSKESQYDEALSAVSNLSWKMRSQWVWHRLENRDEEPDLFDQSAVETGRLDFTIQVYEDAAEYWVADPEKHFNIQLSIAWVYRRLANATKMADRILQTILDDFKNKKLLVQPRAVGDAFTELVDVIHETFTVSHVEKVRKQAVERLQILLHDYRDSPGLEREHLATAMLSLANMHREMGDKESYKRLLGKAFRLCINDLEDSMEANDMDALVLLAKLLMCVDMDVHAKVAHSLIFSRLYHDPNYDSDSDSDSSGDGPPNGTSETGETGAQIDPGIEQSELDPNNSQPHIIINAKELSSGIENNEGLESILNESADPDAAKMDKTPDLHAAKELPLSTPPDNPSPKQDLVPDRLMWCNGTCGKKIMEFGPSSDKGLVCLVCPDVYFCRDCHKKQVELYEKSRKAFWYRCCWAKHEYVETPVDGWLGVRKGVIRFGENEIPWSVWLELVIDTWKYRIERI
ncbi:uncharacterized protein N7479_010384 [Penicillium vulpinum]|uniref:uncharacterized protein n=1 Tax=Penicillium vulpinum TaxID=29845 RepID=UPI00254765B4|nr:uncharacterized protein N7479_010384 [Penicillium vulpinum]KAJ5951971.1 hypothetical protein N7479_010384 [Penicillium vulpinum]